MDNVLKTTQDAFINYFNSLRRLGNITQQDKYKLFVLWFFYFLKYKSDFLYDIKITEVENENGEVIQKKYEWFINRDWESYVNKVFKSNIECLLQDSCFIHLLNTDNCYPVLEALWGEPIIKVLELLVTNATDTGDKQLMFDDRGEKPLAKQLEDNYGVDFMGNGNFMLSNDDAEDPDDDKNEEYLTANKNKYV